VHQRLLLQRRRQRVLCYVVREPGVAQQCARKAVHEGDFAEQLFGR
jgi:hypothetical protein